MGVVGSIRSFLDFEITCINKGYSRTKKKSIRSFQTLKLPLLSRNISKWLMYREGLIEFVETMIKALEGLI